MVVGYDSVLVGTTARERDERSWTFIIVWSHSFLNSPFKVLFNFTLWILDSFPYLPLERAYRTLSAVFVSNATLPGYKAEFSGVIRRDILCL